MTPTRGAPNVIVFGETGAGKSSIINMLAGTDVALTSNTAIGCTFESTCYSVLIHGATFNLWDTSGLNEGKEGKVPTKDAIINLYDLIRGLEEGVSLLVYCVRGPRIKEQTKKNYKMFWSIFCQEKVPIVIVVTGLENEEPMDAWWQANGGTFNKYGMIISGHACVTATRGKKNKNFGHKFDDEYEESVEKVHALIGNFILKTPWRMERTKWFSTVVIKLYNFFAGLFNWGFISLSQVLCEALKYAGFADREAVEVTNQHVLNHGAQ
jgi:50S ribosome-binding GTPase